MGQLLFYDDKHVYEVDGQKIPSVSEIIRFLSREEYQDVSQYTLDNAAERGTKGHKAIENLIKYGECDIEPDIEPYINSFVAWLNNHEFELIACEKALACADYAGRIDMVAMVDKKVTLIDLKFVSAVHKTVVKAQLNGYKFLWESNGLQKIEQMLCLQPMNTGKCREYQVAMDPSEFVACLVLHKASERKHGRGVIE